MKTELSYDLAISASEYIPQSTENSLRETSVHQYSHSIIHNN